MRKEEVQQRKKADELHTAINTCSAQQAELESKIDAAKGKQTRLDHQLKERGEWIQECTGASEAVLLEGEALDWWQQYRQLQNSRSESIQRLVNDLQETNKSKVHMLKIELPERVDEEIARERMKTYVEGEAKRLAQAIRSEQPRSILLKKAGGSVASRVLLNTMLGKTAIPVKVF